MKLQSTSICRQFPELPAATAVERLASALRDHHAVFSAPTGSGKTTLIPLALLESSFFTGRKILLLEPRRIAARAAAVRMSSMIGSPVGTMVGYRTRFESHVSDQSLIEVVTEGVLIRKLQHDPELTGVSLVIFDEFHERSLQSDLGLALCLDLCELRDDLRLLIMSATLETEKISSLLGNAPIITSEGKSYPVEIIHHEPRQTPPSIVTLTCSGIRKAITECEGDILAFLPGAGEIRKCQQALANDYPDIDILPLYGNLSHEEQDRVFTRTESTRRLILATPIAETSLTIENISCVVDSGYCRQPVHDNASGLTRLVTTRISKSSANQRAGRAGRLGPGRCYRLWSSAAEQGLLEHTVPEIIKTDLCELILQLALWGVTDPDQLKWLDPPRESAWENGVALLRRLDLIDAKRHISETGKHVARLPMHPRLGVIIIESMRLDLLWTGCLLTSALSDRDPLHATADTVDLEARIRYLDKGYSRSNSTRIAGNHLPTRLRQQAKRLYDRFKREDDSCKVNYHELGNLLAFGFPDRIALQRGPSSNRYQLANGRGAELSPDDPMVQAQLIVAPHADARHGHGKIFLAAQLNEDDLYLHHSHLLEELENIRWDRKLGRVVSSQELRLDQLVLSSKPLNSPDSEKVAEVFLEGIRELGTDVLPWNKDARELQARIDFLHHWHPDEWPDLSDQRLGTDMRWLAPYTTTMYRVEELKTLDLKAILLSFLTWEQQTRLETLAPPSIRVPSGSRIRLTYSSDQPPVLAVRLQELFGLLDTPAVCNGKVPVLLHLLSPARRPMQVTSDLRSFWQNTYPQVRKELAGRYPKHYWPIDPLEAQATTKTKKRM